MTKVAFIGLGNMGGPMAANLVEARHDVAGFDVVPALLDGAKAGGVSPAASARAAVEGASAVVTMLPAAEHALQVWSDVLPVVAPGTVMIDCSTIDVASARRLHELAAERGCPSLDAPVSGGVGGAKAAHAHHHGRRQRRGVRRG